MYKKILGLIAVSVFLFGCEKDTLIENKTIENRILSDWYHILSYDATIYPFVLPTSEDPFQYAAYQDDMQIIFDNIETYYFANNAHDIYFVFALDENDSIFYYGMIEGLISNGGFLVDTSGYFQSIDNMDEEVYLHIPTKKISTTDKEKYDKWVEKKMRQGYTVTEWKDGAKYMAVAQRFENQ